MARITKKQRRGPQVKYGVHVRIKQDVHDAVAAQADAERRTISAVVDHALRSVGFGARVENTGGTR